MDRHQKYNTNFDTGSSLSMAGVKNAQKCLLRYCLLRYRYDTLFLHFSHVPKCTVFLKFSHTRGTKSKVASRADTNSLFARHENGWLTTEIFKFGQNEFDIALTLPAYLIGCS